MFWNRKKRISLEHQIETLRECGLPLAPGVDADWCMESLDREEFEGLPFFSLLHTIGATEVELESAEHACECLTTLYLRGVEDEDYYNQELRDCLRTTGGEIIATEIAGHVDHDAGESWLAFTCAGRRQEWQFEQEARWASAVFFEALARLPAELGLDRRFVWLAEDVEESVLGYLDAHQLSKLVRAGIKWRPVAR